MKKITNFIVEKRNIILFIFIILSGISLYIGTKVNINYDIAEYLPTDSETRIGMDIMNSNFEPLKSSNLNVMFKDLNLEEQESINEYLKTIENVSSVSHDDTIDYNKNGYSLYVINVDDYSDSKAASKIYQEVKDKYKDYEMYLGGSINDSNKPVIQTWILATAIVFAMIILIIMCDSFVEPFLFLFVIGLAVFLNKGTNIIFPNVSHITNSISAILQMALSMDYSIMLMNRYTQEKAKTKDKKEAMKKALNHAFGSIASSSVTTIVGLLALVFMSFTIGRDLGFVLAKGVLFSLLTIFLCLPALILIFDKAIERTTKKKKIELKFDKLGNLSYKMRYPALIIFIILFGISFIFKDNLGILYTDSEENEIAKHFKETNQIAVIYNNEYEDLISNYCQNLNDENIKQVLCYGNTINEELKYDELNKQLENIGSSTNIDDYLIKLVYYNYYHNESVKMTANEFINFIEKNVYPNETLNSKVDKNMKNNLEKLKNFTNQDKANLKRNESSIASILGVEKNTIQDLFILYNSKSTTIKISPVDFLNFITKDVLTNSKYSSTFTPEMKNNLKQITTFSNKDLINKKMNAKELSDLFGIGEENINNLMILYYTKVDINYLVSLSEFILKTSYLKENTNYLDGVDVSSLLSLVPLAKNENNINNTKLDYDHLKAYYSTINPDLVDLVYNNLEQKVPMTPLEFLTLTLTKFSPYLPEESLPKLNLIKMVMEDSITQEKKTYSVGEMSKLIGLDETSLKSLYTLIASTNNYEFTLSPVELVNVIITNKENPLISSSLNTNTIKTLSTLKELMNAINNGLKYSSKEISNLLGAGENDIKLLYSLYELTYVNKNYKISLSSFTNFLVNDVLTNQKYSANLDAESKKKLQAINKIIKENKTKYDASTLYTNLLPLTSSLDKSLIELLYLYNGSINNYNETWVLTVEEFVKYLNEEIITDTRFANFIDDELKNKIIASESMIDDAKELLTSKNYSRMILNTTYPMETEETFAFIKNIKEELNTKGKEIYIIGDSPMAYDLSGTFSKELDFITILTMIAIFVVVAFTFKSLIVPLILVLIIECAVYLTMSILAYFGGNVYFISLLIVQSILMGATIDYAIVYTSYYKESRSKLGIKESLINAYNRSIHTILTSASILIIVTFIVGQFASAVAAKICMTLSEGTICALILILFILPSIISVFDRFICKKKNTTNESVKMIKIEEKEELERLEKEEPKVKKVNSTRKSSKTTSKTKSKNKTQTKKVQKQ